MTFDEMAGIAVMIRFSDIQHIGKCRADFANNEIPHGALIVARACGYTHFRAGAVRRDIRPDTGMASAIGAEIAIPFCPSDGLAFQSAGGVFFAEGIRPRDSIRTSHAIRRGGAFGHDVTGRQRHRAALVLVLSDLDIFADGRIGRHLVCQDSARQLPGLFSGLDVTWRGGNSRGSRRAHCAGAVMAAREVDADVACELVRLAAGERPGRPAKANTGSVSERARAQRLHDGRAAAPRPKFDGVGSDFAPDDGLDLTLEFEPGPP